MLQDTSDVLSLIAQLYRESPPAPFTLLDAICRVRAGEDALRVARDVHSTRSRIESLAAATDPILALLGVTLRSSASPEAMPEPDMHFSLRDDLTPLEDFLQSARERGLHGLAVDLERGVV